MFNLFIFWNVCVLTCCKQPNTNNSFLYLGIGWRYIQTGCTYMHWRRYLLEPCVFDRIFLCHLESFAFPILYFVSKQLLFIICDWIRQSKLDWMFNRWIMNPQPFAHQSCPNLCICILNYDCLAVWVNCNNLSRPASNLCRMCTTLFSLYFTECVKKSDQESAHKCFLSNFE